jgi:hypothetical protein
VTDDCYVPNAPDMLRIPYLISDGYICRLIREGAEATEIFLDDIPRQACGFH